MEIAAIKFLKTRNEIPPDIVYAIGRLITEGKINEKKAAIEFFSEWNLELSFTNFDFEFDINFLWDIFLMDPPNSSNVLKLILRISEAKELEEPSEEIIENLKDLAFFTENPYGINELPFLAMKILEIGGITSPDQ